MKKLFASLTVVLLLAQNLVLAQTATNTGATDDKKPAATETKTETPKTDDTKKEEKKDDTKKEETNANTRCVFVYIKGKIFSKGYSQYTIKDDDDVSHAPTVDGFVADSAAMSIATSSRKDECNAGEVTYYYKEISKDTDAATKKTKKELENQPLWKTMQELGYGTAKKDRKALAEKFGIKDYKGTLVQNLKLKKMLIESLASEDVPVKKATTKIASLPHTGADVDFVE